LRVCEGLESLRRIDRGLWHGWWRHPLLNRQSGNVPEVMRVIDDRNPPIRERMNGNHRLLGGGTRLGIRIKQVTRSVRSQEGGPVWPGCDSLSNRANEFFGILQSDAFTPARQRQGMDHRAISKLPVEARRSRRSPALPGRPLLRAHCHRRGK
ncbi:hypothetical protein D6833_12885, partial [Candidatus Parcubacteria bacterium]